MQKNKQMQKNIAAIKSAAHLLVDVIPMEFLDACIEYQEEERKIDTLYIEGKHSNKMRLSDRLHELKYKI